MQNKENTEEVSYPELSQREKQVLKAVGDGLSTAEIAKKLELSTHTIDTYRRSIMSKYRAKNMTEAVKIFYSNILNQNL